jgi:hypothetical protein
LLPQVSETSFAIQRRLKFRRLGELDVVDPAGALGVFIEEFGLAGQCFLCTGSGFFTPKVRTMRCNGNDSPNEQLGVDLRDMCSLTDHVG